MGALALLRGERYAINPGDQFSGQPQSMGTAPEPQPAPMDQANALALVPQQDEQEMQEPMPSQAMGQPRAMTVGASPDQMAGQTQYPDWFDDDDKKLYERGKKIRRNYQKAVDARRQRRRADKEYGKVYNTFEKHRDAYERLEGLQKNYPEMFRSDDLRTLDMIKQQMMHKHEAKLARDKIMNMLQRNGIKLGPKDNIPDSLFGDPDEDDRQFDQWAKHSVMDMMVPGDDR